MNMYCTLVIGFLCYGAIEIVGVIIIIIMYFSAEMTVKHKQGFINW